MKAANARQVLVKGSRVWSLVLIALLSFSLTAQNLPDWMKAGSEQQLMNNGFLFTPIAWNALGDPAGRAKNEGLIFGLCSVQPYGLPELSQLGFSGTIATGNQTLGIGLIHSQWNRQGMARYAVSGGLQITKAMRLGVSLNLFRYRWYEDLKDEFSFASRISMRYSIQQNFELAAGVSAPSGFSKARKDAISKPAIVELGLKWLPHRGIDMTVIILRDQQGYMSISTMSKIHISRSFRLMFAYHTASGSSGLGFQYFHSRFSLTASLCNHSILGYSPAADIVYRANPIQE